MHTLTAPVQPVEATPQVTPTIFINALVLLPPEARYTSGVQEHKVIIGNGTETKEVDLLTAGGCDRFEITRIIGLHFPSGEWAYQSHIEMEF